LSKTTRTRALLAIAFASGIYSSHLPAVAARKSESTHSMVQQITENTKLAPELQAFYLLKLANAYLNDDDPIQAEKSVRTLVRTSNADWVRQQSKIQTVVSLWAKDIYSSEQITGQATEGRKEAKLPVKTDLPTQLADDSLKEALLQLLKCNDKTAQEDMYFIASRLFRKVGNLDGERDCRAIRNKLFEKTTDNRVVEIRTNWSILNTKASRILPLTIPDEPPPSGFKWASKTPKEVFTESEFLECEKLKLQALTWVDKLSTESNLRRKAHRDMTLWYLHFGKLDQAENEKQILFNLTGIYDDSVLFPTRVACGQMAWWYVYRNEKFDQCGMG
jgi:hypothetical protein